jgi:FtsZ-binding cell division protein ZapB
VLSRALNFTRRRKKDEAEQALSDVVETGEQAPEAPATDSEETTMAKPATRSSNGTKPYRPAGVPQPRPASAATAVKSASKAPAVGALEDGGVVELLERIQDNLATLSGEHRQRVVEFKVSVAEGLRQALGVMEVQSERLSELLKSNQGLTRNVVGMARDVSKNEAMLANVDDQVADLRERRDSLAGRLAEMIKRRDTLKSELKHITDEHANTTEKNASLREEIGKLDHDNELLRRETEKLEKTRNRLSADVERLTRLREEFQANIKRLKGLHGELTS